MATSPHAMQASDKFKMALDIEPSKHDALWCLGNAYTSQVQSHPRQISASMPSPNTARHIFQVLMLSQETDPPHMPLQGFLTTETMRALDFFEQATDCFRKALHEVPDPAETCECAVLQEVVSGSRLVSTQSSLQQRKWLSFACPVSHVVSVAGAHQ